MSLDKDDPKVSDEIVTQILNLGDEAAVAWIFDNYTLEKIKNLPSYQPMVILKGLIYRKIVIFDKNFSWETAKKRITEEVEKYQAKLITIGF